MTDVGVRRCKRSRGWNRAEGLRHLQGHGDSGLTVRAYCLAHGLKEWTFYNWRRRLAMETLSRAESGEASGTPAQPVFAEVVVASPVFGHEPFVVEVVLPGDRRLRVGAGFDEDTLRRVVAVLESLPC